MKNGILPTHGHKSPVPHKSSCDVRKPGTRKGVWPPLPSTPRTVLSCRYPQTLSNPSIIPHPMSRQQSRRYFSGFKKGQWWREKRFRLFQERGGVCGDCRQKLPLDIAELHHVLPRSKGGRDVDAYLLLLCRECHKRRHG